MKKREDEIKGRFDEAEKREREAQTKKEANDKEREKFDQKNEQMLNDAKEKAEQKRKELVNKAEEEVEGQRKEWLESLEKERESFLDEMRTLASRQVYSLAGKVISELADSDLDEMIFNKFMSKLKNLEEEKKKELTSSADKEKNIVIKSSSGLSKELRSRFTRIVHEEIYSEAEVSYETDQNMMPGIEFNCGGQEIIWSTEKYLDELEQETNRKLDKQRNKLKSGTGEKNKEDNEKDDENDQGEE
jgi:F-type H+-transporting ATPase subunit b